MNLLNDNKHRLKVKRTVISIVKCKLHNKQKNSFVTKSFPESIIILHLKRKSVEEQQVNLVFRVFSLKNKKLNKTLMTVVI